VAPSADAARAWFALGNSYFQSAIKARRQSTTKRTIVTETTVSTCWKKKMSPKPRKKRTDWRSIVARDMSWPVWLRS